MSVSNSSVSSPAVLTASENSAVSSNAFHAEIVFFVKYQLKYLSNSNKLAYLSFDDEHGQFFHLLQIAHNRFYSI